MKSRYHPNQNVIALPTHLFLTIESEFGICPYLHPKYDHQHRLAWLDLLHQYKHKPTSTVVVDQITNKYVLRTGIIEETTKCIEMIEQLKNLLNVACDWNNIERQISQWIVLSSKGIAFFYVAKAMND